jgi:hypothetical protein
MDQQLEQGQGKAKVEQPVAPAAVQAPSTQTNRTEATARHDMSQEVAAPDAPDDIKAAAARGVQGAAAKLPHLERLQQAFGDHDLQGVKAVVGGPARAASAEIQAVAFATPERVGFAEAPDLFTAAHEAAHVIQQRHGQAPEGGVDAEHDALEQAADDVARAVVAGGSAESAIAQMVGPAVLAASPDPAVSPEPEASTVQRRRVPGEAPLNDTMPAGGANAAAHEAGLTRLLTRTVGTLTPEQRGRVLARLLRTLPGDTVLGQLAALVALPERERLLALSSAVRAEYPDLELGDPNLIDTGARPGTDDTAHITTLVTNTDQLFSTAVSAAHDANLAQIFGQPQVATAKQRYRAGQAAMNALHTQNHIVTDRSGYNDEAGLGGLTGADQISLHSDVVDNPDDQEGIVTMLHESMHAGNSDVGDHGYIGSSSFTELDAQTKLDNAAHYEVTPRRIYDLDGDYEGQEFVPAGTTSGGVTAPPATDRDLAIRGCEEALRQAWTVALNLHTIFGRAYANPAEWTTLNLATVYGAGSAPHFADALPYWSKVEQLTVHEKTVVNATGGAATAPFSQIDMALSEGLIHKFALAMQAAPSNGAQADTLLALASATERAAATTVATEARLLVTLVLRERIGEITGPVARDLRVLDAFNGLSNQLSDFVAARDPADFPD